MPARDVSVSISSNNGELEKIFLANNLHPEVNFVKDKSNLSYRVFLIDLQKDLTHISQQLIDTYGLCREHDSKLVAIILHGDTIDIEKNHYFQKMLDDLGKDKPLHRLIFTKDIYQHISPTPITPLDHEFYNATTTQKINISQKGENLVFPLSLEDFIAAVLKTLFLSNTSGKSFWILGDPIPDLELAYLLKKNISATNLDDPDINADKKNDPKINSLSSIGNKSRIELDWQPENEIIDDLRHTVTLYADKPVIKEINQSKTNPLYNLLNWIYKPRPKSKTHLPTIKKIGLNLLFVFLTIYLILGGVFALVTGLSLSQLERSINQALNGNLTQSVTTLNNVIKSKEIGESLLTPIVPLANLISPRGTEKIFNLYSFLNYSSASLNNLHKTYVLAESLLLSLNSTDNKTNFADLSLALHSNLSQIYENINQISFLSNGGKLPGFLDKKLKDNSTFKNLKTLEEQVSEYIKIVDIIPAVFSGDTSKTILVLLQNSHVLRPSGGEIDYYLLLTLNQGKLISKKYFTQQELEALFNSTTTPALKNTKKNTPPTLTLAELSQNPDFSISSNNLSTYLEKALKIRPDFIIASNDLLVKQLLSEEKSNLTDQFINDYLSPSGLTLYKDLVDQYLDRLFNQNISLPVLGRTIAKIIGDNQILLWSADVNTERLIASQSYSGVLALHPCNAGVVSLNKCLAETSYLSESTPQKQRQSPWSSRQISHTVNITSSSVQHEYQIDYQTTTPPASPSATTALYHLYLPSPSSLDKVLFNDLPTSTKDLEKTTEKSFDHYKIPIILSQNQNTSVVIKATTALNLSFLVPFSYSITEYRQPGTTDPGTSLKIIYPENLHPVVVTTQFTPEPRQLRLNLPPHTSTFGFTLDKITQ